MIGLCDKRIMSFNPIHLKIKSHPENLKQVRKIISDATSEISFSKEDSGSIILAVDEACSNIIRHSYKNDHTKEIQISIEATSASLAISIIDKGKKFDINSIKSRDITQLKPGGLGLYIIQHVMDHVQFKHTPEGYNQLTMMKKVNP